MTNTEMARPSNSKIGSEFYQKLAGAVEGDLFNVKIEYWGPSFSRPPTPDSRRMQQDEYSVAKVSELERKYNLEFNFPAASGLLPHIYFQRNASVQLTVEDIKDADQNIEGIFKISEGSASDTPYLVKRRTKEEINQAFLDKGLEVNIFSKINAEE